jgi:UDP-glucose 4-epimerase
MTREPNHQKMNKLMRKMLVTGAAGFIGRHVALAAARAGHRVCGLGHGHWDVDERTRWGVTDWISASVTREHLDALPWLPDVIVHCAGGSAVAPSLQRPAEEFQRTVQSTQEILEYARTQCPQAHVVLVSSAGVYGAATDFPIREESACRPVSPYGAHKLMAEQLSRAYNLSFGLPVSVVRMFSVYGAGLRKQLLWDACGKIRAGQTEFPGTGLETRDWIHVEDAASLLVQVAVRRSSHDFAVFNGGSGQEKSVSDIVNALAMAMGRSAEIRFNGVSRAGDPTRYWSDNNAALGLEWTPVVPLDDGLQRYVRWFEEAQP